MYAIRSYYVCDRLGMKLDDHRVADGLGRLLAPGGVLVYCVCSLQAAEEAAAPPPGFAADPVRPDELPGWEFALRADGCLRTLPSYNFV